MFHGHSNSKCKILIERKYIEVCFKVLFINKFKMAYMCASGPWKHTRALGAVLEMKVQKEKKYILGWKLMEVNSPKYIFTPVKLFG